jgi:hypothetical protein
MVLTTVVLNSALVLCPNCSSIVKPCPNCAAPSVSSPAAPTAALPVYDWPERREPHESPHQPHEERVTVDSGASGNFTNASARTISYTYTQTPFLRNLLSERLIAVLDDNATADEWQLADRTNSEVVHPDTKKHLSTASNHRDERARVNRPRFDRPRG